MNEQVKPVVIGTVGAGYAAYQSAEEGRRISF